MSRLFEKRCWGGASRKERCLSGNRRNGAASRSWLHHLTGALALALISITCFATPAAAAVDFPKQTVKTVSPSGTTINLFDYWITGENSTADLTGDNQGINREHALKFNTGGGSGMNSWTGNDYGGRVTGRGIGPRWSMVDNTLDNGYPKLAGNYNNGATQSLAYLFDGTRATGKASHLDVKGLLQVQDGYYVYNSRDNYAAYDEDTNSFNVYNTYGVLKANAASRDGQFFPFNKASDVFDEKDGKLQRKNDVKSNSNNIMNHHFGLSMASRFMQPTGGKTNNGKDDMVFEFTGDDDVWVFIDDVLVGDLGGIHSAASLSINFSTGDVKINGDYTNWDTTNRRYQNDWTESTNLRALFRAAGKESVTEWGNGDQSNTFADNTKHTLNFFYLERGAVDSNMKLKFNLVPVPQSEVYKVDEDGSPVADASFKLFAADGEYNVAADASPVAEGTTNTNGELVLVNPENRSLLTFDDLSTKYKTKHFVLQETDRPAGYGNNLLGTDSKVYLEYKTYGKDNTGGIVVDRGGTAADGAIWRNGAFTSTKELVAATTDVYEVNADGTKSDKKVDLQDGLLFAVVLKRVPTSDGGSEWHAVYGDPYSGYKMADATDYSGIIDAAKQPGGSSVLQLDTSGQYLTEIENLPGDITKYYFLMDDTGAADKAEYAVGFYYAKGANNINQVTTGNIKRVYSEDFTREFSARVNVPNTLHQFYVQKDDGAGKFVAGAEFKLYKEESVEVSADGTGRVTTDNPVDTVTTQAKLEGEGLPALEGAAVIPSKDSVKLDNGIYYLKETKAPNGYKINDHFVKVIVTDYGVYADAGNNSDGVRTSVGVGKLMKTMAQFGAQNDINSTLTYIQANKQTGTLGDDDNITWSPESFTGEGEIRLNYAAEKKLLEYGPREADGKMAIESETGIIRAAIRQDEILKDPNETVDEVVRTYLGDMLITNLFSGSTSVIVSDEPVARLQVTKTVNADSNLTPDPNAEFTFKFTLPAAGSYTYRVYEKDKDGKEQLVKLNDEGKTELPIANGGTVTIKAGQTIRVYGLNKDDKYAVEEVGAAEAQPTLFNLFGLLAANDADKMPDGFSLTERNAGGQKYQAATGEAKNVISGTIEAIDEKDESLPVPLNNQLEFVNTYKVKEFDATDLFHGQKVITGDRDPLWQDGDSFIFRVVAEKGTPLPTGKDISKSEPVEDNADWQQVTLNVKNGDIFSFGTIAFTEPNTYTYYISEVTPVSDEQIAGLRYSDAVYKVTVTVKDTGKGTLEVTDKKMEQTFTDDGASKDPAINVPAVDDRLIAKITNTFSNATSNAPIRIHKHYDDQSNGNGLSAGKFQFEIKALGGLPNADAPDDNNKFDNWTYSVQSKDVPVPQSSTTTNDATGIATFNIQYSLSANDGDMTYIYAVWETPDFDTTVTNGMTYDTAHYFVKVVNTVEKATGSEDKDQLRTVVTYWDANGNQLKTTNADGQEVPSAEIPFNNTYKVDKATSAVISGQKTLDGRPWDANEHYTFTLSAADGTDTSGIENWAEIAKVVKGSDAQNGTAQFDFGSLVFTKVGTYTFNIKETVDADTLKDAATHGMTYDGHTTTVTIVVTDVNDAGEHTGNLVASAPLYNNTGTLNDAQASLTDKAYFTNRYRAKGSTEPGITVTKTMQGKDLSTGEYNFTIEPLAADTTAGTADAHALQKENLTFSTGNADEGVAYEMGEKLGNINLTQANLGKTYVFKVTEDKADQDGNGYTNDSEYPGAAYAYITVKAKASNEAQLYTVTTVVKGPDANKVMSANELAKFVTENSGDNVTNYVQVVDRSQTDAGTPTVPFVNKYETSLNYSAKGGLQISKTFAGTGAAEATVFTFNVKPLESKGGQGGDETLSTAEEAAAKLNIDRGGSDFTSSAIALNGQATVVNLLSKLTDGLVFTQADNGKTYTYEVTEKGTDGTPKGYDYDDAVYHVEIAVRDDYNGTLTVTTMVSKKSKDGTFEAIDGMPVEVTNKSESEPQVATVPFANMYKPEGGKLVGKDNLKVSKTLAGLEGSWRKWGDKEEYGFTITKVSYKATADADADKSADALAKMPLPQGSDKKDQPTITIGKPAEGATNSGNFGDMTFTEPGIYEYTITETASPDDKNLTKSQAEYKLVVTVTDEDGTLKPVSALTQVNSDEGTVNNPEVEATDNTAAFVNTYNKKDQTKSVDVTTPGSDTPVTDADGKLVGVGDTLTYKIHWVNDAVDDTGEAVASTVVVADKIPNGTTYVADSATIGTGITVKETKDGDRVTGLEWTINKSVAKPNAEGDLEFKVTVDEPNKDESVTIENQAKVTIDDHSPETNKVTNTTPGKTVVNNPTQLKPGDVLTYKITFKNTSGDGASAKVVDDLAQGLKYVNDSSTLEGANWNGLTYELGDGLNRMTFNLKEMKRDAEVTITFKVEVTRDALASVDNAAIVDGHKSNVVTSPLETDNAKHVEDSKGNTIDGKLVGVGDELTYKIDWANGKQDGDVKIVDTLPEGVTVVDGSISDGGKLSSEGKSITWTLEKKKAGERGTVTFKVKVNDGAVTEPGEVNTLENTATVNGVKVLVENYIPGKKAEGDTGSGSTEGDVYVGKEITYTIAYKNTEVKAATVTITDKVPSGTELVKKDDGSYDISNGGVSSDGKTITWTLNDVAAGTTGTVSFKVRVTEDALEQDDGIKNDAIVEIGENNPKVSTNTTTTEVKTGELSISKTVSAGDTGATLDPNQEFEFAITLTDAGNGVLTGEYKYEGTAADDKNGGKLDFKSGSATVKLKGGQTITLKGLPAGAEYTVKETPVTGFTPTRDTFSNVIVADKKAEAAFTNTFTPAVVTSPLQVTKKLDGNRNPGLQNGEFSFTATVNPVGESPNDGAYFSMEGDNPVTSMTVTNGVPSGSPETVNFGAGIAFTKVGTYKVTVVENVPEKDDANYNPFIDYVTPKENTYSYEVEVYRDGNALKTRVKQDSKKGDSTFTNTYKKPEQKKDVFNASSDDPKTSVNGKLVGVGDKLTYTINWANDALDNSGKAVAADVTVTDALPEGTELATKDDGTLDVPAGATYDETTRTLTWELGNQAAGATGTVEFDVVVTDAAVSKDEIANKATINIGDHSAETNEVINTTPKKTVDGKPSVERDIQVGDELTYTISWANTTGKTANVTVKDVLSDGLTFVSATEGGSYDEASRTVAWDLGSKKDGDSGTVQVTVRVNEDAVKVDANNSNKATIQVGDKSSFDTNTVPDFDLKTGSLTISKTVVVPGNLGLDAEAANQKDFTFTVELKDAAGNALTGEYAYKGEGDAADGTIKNGGKITLKHGQSVVISGLPEGTQYTVTETKVDGFTPDPKNGVQSGSVTAAGATAAFTNTYAVTPGTLKGATNLEVTKKLTGRDWAEGDSFTFALTANTEDPATNAAVEAGNIVLPKNADELVITKETEGHKAAFGDITFKQAGDFQFYITEQKGDLGGVSYDTAGKLVRVHVADNGNGTLTAEVTAGKPLTITNEYKTEGASTDTTGLFTKMFVGKQWGDEKFDFEIEALDGAPVPENTKAEVTKDSAEAAGIVEGETAAGVKSFDFGNISFTDADMVGKDDKGEKTFTYEVRENHPEGAVKADQTGEDFVGRHDDMWIGTDGITYDGHVATLSITVKDDGRGNLSVTDVKVKKGNFSNLFEAASENAMTVEVSKTLTGRDMTEGETFTFNAVTNDAATADRLGISADANKPTTFTTPAGKDNEAQTATVPLNALSFTQEDVGASYTFTVSEVNDGKGGVTYDDTAYTVEIAVSQDADGKLVVTATVTDNKGSEPKVTTHRQGDESAAVVTLPFKNSYTSEMPATEFAKTAATFEKVLEGRDWFRSDGFTFELKPVTSGAPMPKEHQGVTVENGVAKISVDKTSAPRFSFGKIEFTYDMVKNEPNKTKTFEYEVTEVKGKIPGVTYDEHAARWTVTVKDDGQGKLTATTVNTNNTFTNTYSSELDYTATSGVQLQKTLNGRDMTDGQFAFTLSNFSKGAAEKLGLSSDADAYKVTAAAAGEASTINLFAGKDVKFTNKDEGKTYSFDVTETTTGTPEADKNGNGYTNDTVVRHVQIAVTYNEATGVLTVTTTVTADGKDTITKVVTSDGKTSGGAAVIPFTNAYEASTTADNGTSAVIEAKKELTGRPLEEGEFAFTLTGPGLDAAGKTVHNQGDKVSFGTFDYTAADLEAMVDGTAVKRITTEEGKRGWELSYTAAEVTDGLADKGLTASRQSFPVTVTVVDNGNGSLTANVSYPAEDKGGNVFKNTYNASEVTLSLNGKKFLEHADNLTPNSIEGKFTFTLTDEAGNKIAEAKNDANGNVSFPNVLTYTLDAFNKEFGTTENEGTQDKTEEGVDAQVVVREHTYTYYVEETGSAPGVTNDAAAKKVIQVKVTDDGEGHLTAQVVKDDQALDFTFTNTYTVQPVASSITDQLSIGKTIDGREMQAGEFDFVMVDAAGNTVAAGDNDQAGTSSKVTFTPIQFTEPGEYDYTVRELNSGKGGVSYDGTSYQAHASVKDNGDGTLSVTWTFSKGGATGDEPATEGIVFKNTYTAKPTSITFNAAKVLTGRDLKAGEFTFQLREDGKVLQTVKNGVDGDVKAIKFDAITYDKVGEHDYEIVEVKGKDANVTYDKTVFTYHVSVTDDGNGSLVATWTVGEAGEPVFHNVYTEPAKPEPKPEPEPEEPAKPSKPELPQTGDSTPPTGVLATIAAFGAALVGGGVALIKRRR